MSRKLLIADDEETIRWALRELFMQDGWEVHCAGDGAEAARMAAGTEYDYLISDLRMPGLSGADLLRETRRRKPDMGVTLLTGYPSLETAVEALRLGAWDYRAKPFSVLALKERVDEFCRLKRTARAGAGSCAELAEADVMAFLDGAGTQLLPACPLHSGDGEVTAFDRLRDVFADLGFNAQRSGDVLQCCVEGAAALPEHNGDGCARAALLRGRLLVGLSAQNGAVEAPSAASVAFAERVGVDMRIVRRDGRCTVVLSEAL